MKRSVRSLKEEIPNYVAVEVTEKPSGVPAIQYAAFCHIMDGKTKEQTAALIGRAASQIYVWQREAWWKELQEVFVQVKQDEVHMRIIAKGDSVVKAFEDVVTGLDVNDKTAAARAKLIQMYLELGKNPALQKNPQLNINHNTQNNNYTLDSNLLNSMTEEEMIEFSRGGIIPHREVKEIS